MKSLLIISVLFFLRLLKCHDISISYSVIEDSKVKEVSIYSGGKYNDLFQYEEDKNKKSAYIDFLLGDCGNIKSFIVPPSALVSSFLIQSHENKENFEITILSDVENSHLLNPKLNSFNDSLILSGDQKLIINLTYDCNIMNEIGKTNFSPWSRVFLDIKERRITEDTLNENNTKNYSFSFLKFCESPKRTYESLLVLMVLAIIIVYYATIQPPIQTDSPESQQIQPIHAFFFVLFGSLFLMVLYFFLPYVITLLTCLILLTSLSSLTILFTTIMEKWGPLNLNYYIGNIPYYGLIKMNEILCFISSVLICLFYVFTKNWLLNNLIGISMVLLLVRTIRMPNYFVALLMLGFSFFYDIFWVFLSTHLFGTSVMAHVATHINLPLKIICPTFSITPLQTCSLLGLGDMALPGFFISYCFSFDSVKKISIYHFTSLVSYSLALGICLLCLIVFNSAQPALLYISPCLLLSVGYVGWKRGEFRELWYGFEEKINIQAAKRIDLMTFKDNKKEHDEIIEHDREENYFNNTVFEMRKEEV